MPQDFGEALTWALDWALLASFRERLRLIEAFNGLVRKARELGDPAMANYREIKVVIVSPEDFFPAARIIDYDARNGLLIQQGYQAAEQAFQAAFPG